MFFSFNMFKIWNIFFNNFYNIQLIRNTNARTLEDHNSWFWRHKRKIKDIKKIYEIKPGYSRMTLYKK